MAEYFHILDLLLVQVGQYGKYQCFLLALYCLAIGINSSSTISFVFTAQDLTYRCLIPECNTTSADLNPHWLQNAVPFYNGEPDKCERYKYLNHSSTCNLANFDRKVIEKCDLFIYKTAEKRILNEFDNLHCDENLWKLTLVGTINSAGQVIGLPISGYISDRYGRRTLLIWAMLLCGTAGIIKSFTTSYIYFIAMEFIDATLGAGAYTCAFILSVELVGPKQRVLAGSIICGAYAVGEMFTGVVAWFFQSWRPFVFVVYSLNLVMPLYYWLTPESVRWLLTKNKIDEIKRILRNTAKINGKPISESTLCKLRSYEEDKTESLSYIFREYFTDSTLIMRFVYCCFCSVTCTLLYFGLILGSVSLVGNSYLDFILGSFIEIPAYFVTWLTVDRIGRRIYLNLSFLLTSMACICFIFVPPELHWLKLTTYLLGKFGATIAFSTCYIVFSEIFPTHLRNSLMGASLMFGRIGSIVAPQMPLLEKIWKPFPLTLYAIMSILASILCLFFPETTNIKLPDTVKEQKILEKDFKNSKSEKS